MNKNEHCKLTRTTSVEESNLPPVVSKRNHFHALDEYVDEAMVYLGRSGVFGSDTQEQEKIRSAIRYAFRRTLSGITAAISTACSAAVSQAYALILDPDFYENRKQRAKKKAAHSRERNVKEAQRNEERKVFGPTPEEVQERRRHLMRMVSWHRAEMDRCTKELEEIPNVIGPEVKGTARTQ